MSIHKGACSEPALATLRAGLRPRLLAFALDTLLIAYFLIALVTIVWMLRTNPELAQERAQPGRNAKSWDNLLVGLVPAFGLPLALLIITTAPLPSCG